MRIIESPQEMQQLSGTWKCAGESVGFVPTMGALHAGHLALARRAREENSKFVASIFVNPIQFAHNEDLDKYPRPLERDYEALQAAGCDAVFAPSTQTMYGHAPVSELRDSHTYVEVSKLG